MPKKMFLMIYWTFFSFRINKKVLFIISDAAVWKNVQYVKQVFINCPHIYFEVQLLKFLFKFFFFRKVLRSPWENGRGVLRRRWTTLVSVRRHRTNGGWRNSQNHWQEERLSKQILLFLILVKGYTFLVEKNYKCLCLEWWGGMKRWKMKCWKS